MTAMVILWRIEAFFSEEEIAKSNNSGWRDKGQTFHEWAKGYVLGAIKSLEEELENLNLPEEEKRMRAMTLMAERSHSVFLNYLSTTIWCGTITDATLRNAMVLVENSRPCCAECDRRN